MVVAQHQTAVLQLPRQWCQRRPAKLLLCPNAVQCLRLDRLQRAILPVAPRGQQDDAIGIGEQHRLPRLAPGILQRLQRDLDHHDAQRLTLGPKYRRRDEIAGTPGGIADGEEFTAPARQGIDEVGAVVVAIADEAVGLIEVARGHGHAVAVGQEDGRRAGGTRDTPQMLVEITARTEGSGGTGGVVFV